VKCEAVFFLSLNTRTYRRSRNGSFNPAIMITLVGVNSTQSTCVQTTLCVSIVILEVKTLLECEIFQAKDVEKIKPYILCSIIFKRKNAAFYEIQWKNTQPERPYRTIQHSACALYAT